MYTQDRLHYEDKTLVQFRQEEPFYHVFEATFQGDLAGMGEEEVLQAGLRQLMGRIDTGQRALDLEARIEKLEDQVKALMAVKDNAEAIQAVIRPWQAGESYYEGDLVEEKGAVYKVLANHLAQNKNKPKNSPAYYLPYTEEEEDDE